MSNVTRILQQIESGHSKASEELLPLVYDELRQLAARELKNEPSGQTLQPTALVHEAYVRLVDHDVKDEWSHRGHFYMAAAIAMRRILIDRARRKRATKHGGDRQRVLLDEAATARPEQRDDLLALDAAMDALADARPELAELVNLRYFAGLTMEQAAAALGISARTAARNWAYARAWLLEELQTRD